MNKIFYVPWANKLALPALYWDTLWGVCFLHFSAGQKVFFVLGTLTYKSSKGEQSEGKIRK